MEPIKKLLANTHILIAVVVVASLLSIGLSFVLAQPLIDSIKLNAKVLTRKSAANNQLKSNVSAAKTLVESFAALGPTKQRILNALPLTADYPAFAAQVELMAGINGVKLRSVVPTGQAPGTDKLQTAGFNLAVTGTYANVMQFLNTLALSARPIRIENMAVGGNTGALIADIHLTTYFMPRADITEVTGEKLEKVQ